MTAGAHERINFSHLQFEFIGTLMFVYITGWSRIGNVLMNQPYYETSLTVGVLYTILSTIALKRSGGHYNPAITFGLMLVGKVSIAKAVSYITAQLMGSFFGATLIVFTSSNQVIEATRNTAALGLPFISNNFNQIPSFASEFIGTCLITAMYWITLTEDEMSPQVKAYINGVGLVLVTMCFFPISGACFNPAVVFGPSMFSRVQRSYHWLYWFGPMIGSTFTCYILDKMEILRDETMSKKRKVKATDEEIEYEMDIEDQEYEAKKKERMLREGKEYREYELSDDEGLEGNSVKDESDEDQEVINA